MPALLVVELEVGGKALSHLRYRAVCFEVDVLVRDASPEPLDKDVVHPATLSIHTDCNVLLVEKVRKDLRGKLAALVGVEDCRAAISCKSLFQGIRQLRSFFCCMFCDRPRQKVRFCTAIVPRRYSIKDRNDILRNQPGEAPLLKPHRVVGSCGPVQQVVYGIMANSVYNPKCWASRNVRL
jgi:hypothetical protein